MHTDSEGNRFYTWEEAAQALGVRRTTFERMITDEKITRYRKSHDRRYYYRVEDIEGLKNRPTTFRPANEPEKELAAVG